MPTLVSVESIQNGLLVKFPDNSDKDKDGNEYEEEVHFVPNMTEACLLLKSKLEPEPKG